MRKGTIFGASLLMLALVGSASAALYTESFDVDNTANWTVNKSGNATGNLANFFFDYGTYGIGSAPNSTGGTTRGLRLEANITGATFGGLSVSPTGQSFSGDYKLEADVWYNFLGPAPAGGSGSTQAGGLGIGTNGTVAQWAGGTQNSLHFSATGDGNSSVDYRAYSNLATTGYDDAAGIWAAPGASPRNDTNTYYSTFGSKTPPAAQTALFASQTGTTRAGSQAFAWRRMQVEKIGAIVTWKIDGKLISTVNTSALTFSGSNILLNYYDTNGTSATDPNRLNFMLVDNVAVTAVPEPGTMAAIGLGVAALIRRRRSAKR